MQDSILVITPHASFGELIRQSLEETGRYRVEVTYQAADALARCRRPGAYRLVILDGDLPESAPEPLIQGIRATQPAARIAAIPSEAGSGPAPALPVDGTLGKPFYLPNLLATVESLIRGEEPAAPPSLARPSAQDGWPEGESECQARLERLVASIGALGGLYIAYDRVRASAGAAADYALGLLPALHGRLAGAAGSELVLYRKSPDGAGWVLIYVLEHGECGGLALVFPGEVEYSQARAQVRQGVRETARA